MGFKGEGLIASKGRGLFCQLAKKKYSNSFIYFNSAATTMFLFKAVSRAKWNSRQNRKAFREFSSMYLMVSEVGIYIVNWPNQYSNSSIYFKGIQQLCPCFHSRLSQEQNGTTNKMERPVLRFQACISRFLYQSYSIRNQSHEYLESNFHK